MSIEKVSITTSRRPIWRFPPAYFLAALVLSLLLGSYVPLVPFGSSTSLIMAVLLFLAAVTIFLLSVAQFRRAKTTLRPFEPSSALLTTGPYRISRNPIYLAMTLVLISLALGLGNLTPLFLPVLFTLTIDRLFVRHEERMLVASFGVQYEDYCARVRRWL